MDEHSITVCRYDIPNSGLSKFETRWGTFSDPWHIQPQPKCGFVLVGRAGTLSSYDLEPVVRLQTSHDRPAEEVPVDNLQPPFNAAVNYVIHKLQQGEPIDGPLSPKICRIGQQIVDSAVLSSTQKRTVPLVG